MVFLNTDCKAVSHKGHGDHRRVCLCALCVLCEKMNLFFDNSLVYYF